MALHKDVRRQRAFEAFKRRLDGMSPDEIRTMLEERRIRSPERVEVAEARLRQHETASKAAGARAGAAQTRARPGGDGQEAPEAAAGAAAGGGKKVPVARQVGRMLGIGLGIASIAALAVFAIRR